VQHARRHGRLTLGRASRCGHRSCRSISSPHRWHHPSRSAACAVIRRRTEGDGAVSRYRRPGTGKRHLASRPGLRSASMWPGRSDRSRRLAGRAGSRAEPVASRNDLLRGHAAIVCLFRVSQVSRIHTGRTGCSHLRRLEAWIHRLLHSGNLTHACRQSPAGSAGCHQREGERPIPTMLYKLRCGCRHPVGGWAGCSLTCMSAACPPLARSMCADHRLFARLKSADFAILSTHVNLAMTGADSARGRLLGKHDFVARRIAS
jgi:hypothetical protein